LVDPSENVQHWKPVPSIRDVSPCPSVLDGSPASLPAYRIAAYMVASDTL
jgi:hypothetical protein